MGNIDISYKPKKAHNLCRYLAKYVAKNCDETGYNKKRYWRSDSIGEPVKVRFYMHSKTVMAAVNELLGLCQELGIERPDKSLWVSPDASVMVVDG